jgi:hypothetical protein
MPACAGRGDAARTGATFGADVARFRLVGLELAPQAQYLRVDRSVVDVIVVRAGHVEELVAREHAIGCPEENHQETDFAVAERPDPRGSSGAGC